MTAAGLSVLCLIRDNPGCSASELSRLTGVSRQASHQRVSALASAGLVKDISGGKAWIVTDEGRVKACPPKSDEAGSRSGPDGRGIHVPIQGRFRTKFSPYFLFHAAFAHFLHGSSARSGGCTRRRGPLNRPIRSEARPSERGQGAFLPAAPFAQQLVHWGCRLAHDGDKGDLMTFSPPGEPVIEYGHILIDAHSRQSRHAEGAPRAEGPPRMRQAPFFAPLSRANGAVPARAAGCRAGRAERRP